MAWRMGTELINAKDNFNLLHPTHDQRVGLRGLSLGRLRDFLDEQVAIYNRMQFIDGDPISLVHRFTTQADREIVGFWVAVLAWGNRKSIIASGEKLIGLMAHSPHDFILNHTPADRQVFKKFVHRTFNYTDALCFLEFLQHWYRSHGSLELAFSQGMQPQQEHVGPALEYFHTAFKQITQAPARTMKHIASPKSGSRCKRLLMFLRWMVRKDEAGVDFGIWENLKPHQLLLPLDVHVERTARALGLLKRKTADWKAVLELTRSCRELDPSDPVKYDFALFGLSQAGKMPGCLLHRRPGTASNYPFICKTT